MPLANKIDTNRRRAVIAEPRGGGGSAAVVLAVALLAGFLFIGGAAAIYLSNPPGSTTPTDIALGSGSPTLPPFVQQTASPAPTPSPTFILLPSESPSFSPLPTSSFVGPTPPPTPIGPTTPPSTIVVVKFNCAKLGAQRKITCSDNSTGPVASREWDFGDGSEKVTDRNPTHTYPPAGPPNEYTVTLVVTATDGQQYFKQRQIVFDAPPTATPSAAPTTAATATPPCITPDPSAPPTDNPCD